MLMIFFEKRVLVSVCICLGSPRPFSTKGKDVRYPKGAVLDIKENREVEFKCLVRESADRLPWKIMECAKDFACGCLNGNRKGIIYFGVGETEIRLTSAAKSLVSVSSLVSTTSLRISRLF